MNGDPHDMLLGAYSMGVLDPAETRYVESHLALCPACQNELAELVRARDMLAQVPPEVFLEGPPPDDGDLVLRRALRRVRTERRSGPDHRRSLLMAVAAAAVVGITGLGAGVMIGHQDDRAAHSATSLPAGTRTVTASNTNGAKLAATLIPADGWVRVKVRLSGVAAGTNCRIVVVAKNGTAYPAGTWRTSTSGGTPEVDGSALVAPQDVSAVEVAALSGKRLVTAQF